MAYPPACISSPDYGGSSSLKSVDPYRGTDTSDAPSLDLNAVLTMEQAEEDLEFLADTVRKRHCSTVDGLSEEFSSQYEKELSDLPENPTVMDVWRASSRMMKTLGDAHSAVYYVPGMNVGTGLSVSCEGSDFYALTSDGKKKLRGINGVSIEDLYEKFLETASYENEYYAKYSFCAALEAPHYLELCGIDTSKGLNIELDGIAPGESVIFYPWEPNTDDGYGLFYYKIDKENKVGILTINECIVNDDYLKTLEDFFAEVQKHEIKNIAVDLRNNQGGNSMVFNEFARYLNIDEWNGFGADVRYGPYLHSIKDNVFKNKRHDRFIFGGNVYVLTSNKTFSSAMMFSVYTQDNGIGKIIGEPSGNMPSSYGDIIVFRLPNSQLKMVTTYKHFHRPDRTKDAEIAQVPDYPVPADKAVEKFYEIVGEN